MWAADRNEAAWTLNSGYFSQDLSELVWLWIVSWTHRVRVQVLLLAQAVQEWSLFFEEGLSRGEKHGAADIEPDPLAAVPAAGVNDRAVAIGRGAAGLCGAAAAASRGWSPALSRLAVFVVIVVVIVAVTVVMAEAVGRGQFPLVVRGRSH